MKAAAILATLVLAALQCGSAPAEQADSATFRSYQRARAVLQRAIDAHGGLERIRAIENASGEYDGLRTMINQSPRPEGPWDKQPASGRFIIDRRGDRLYMVTSTAYAGIGAFSGAWAITGTEGIHWEPPKNHYGSEIIAKMSGASDTDGTWANVIRWVPSFLLLSAWDNSTNLRWIGAYEKNGRNYEAIGFVERNRRNLVVIIDAGSFLLDGFETIRDDGVYGDITDFTRFSDYVDIAGVKFPTRRTEYQNGEVARELTLKFTVNTTLDESLFKLPAGYSLPSVASVAAPRIRRIGDGVYVDTEMGGVMIIEFKDFLVALDCPDDFRTSQSTIDAVKQVIPDKPFKYVIPSHTHGDHGGGVRAYYYAGTTLLTTPGNRDFYQKLATIKQTILPDPLSLQPRQPVIETFKAKRVITDGTRILEIHDLGPNPHTEEMTFAYLPKQKIVWQSDLLFTPQTGGGLNKAMPIGIQFAKKLRQLGITDFKQLVESHHSRTITLDEFKASLAKAGYDEF